MALPKSLEIFRANGSSSQVIPEWLRNECILSFEGHSKSEWPRMIKMRDEKWDLVRSSFHSKWPWNDCFLSFRPHPVIRDEGWTKRSRQSSIQGHQSKRTDIEVLCEIIYAHGERWNCFSQWKWKWEICENSRYDDGTAAIGFTWLFKVPTGTMSY